jgi:hypothetical protein
MYPLDSLDFAFPSLSDLNNDRIARADDLWQGNGAAIRDREVSPASRKRSSGCAIQTALENDFVVVTGTGNARDFIRLLTVELHGKDREKTGLPDLPI